MLTSQKAKTFLTSRRISLSIAHRYQLGYYDGSELSDLYDRLLFPIFDPYGEFVAYSGRALYDWNEVGTPKYWNDSYDKGRYLYGLYECAERLLNAPFLVLSEGNLDIMALASSGTPGVACLGTTFSLTQAWLIRRYTQNVVTWYDADDAGQRAARLAIPILKSVGLNVWAIPSRASLHDPSEVWEKQGQQGIIKVLNAKVRV